MSHREGSWNYNDGFLLVRRRAIPKLLRIKAGMPVVYWRFVPQELGGPSRLKRLPTCEVLTRFSGHWNAGNPVCQPCYRGLVAVVELWLKHVRQIVARAPSAEEVEDWVVVPALVFFNSVLPSYYRMGSLAFRECVQQEIVKTCGLEVDELAFFQIGAMTVGPAPAVQYRMYDATTGPHHEERAVSVSIPFSVLEEQHAATTFQLCPDWIQQGPAPTARSVGG